jgi:hypothetical protein
MTAKNIVSLFIMLVLLTGCAAGFQNIEQAVNGEENSDARGMAPLAYQSPNKT